MYNNNNTSARVDGAYLALPGAKKNVCVIYFSSLFPPLAPNEVFPQRPPVSGMGMFQVQMSVALIPISIQPKVYCMRHFWGVS